MHLCKQIRQYVTHQLTMSLKRIHGPNYISATHCTQGLKIELLKLLLLLLLIRIHTCMGGTWYSCLHCEHSHLPFWFLGSGNWCMFSGTILLSNGRDI